MPRDQLLEACAACAPAGRGLATRGRVTAGGRAKLWRRQPAQPQAPLEPEGGLPPLRGRRAEGGRHELRATGDLGGGPILGKFGRTGTVKDRLLYNEGPIP